MSADDPTSKVPDPLEAEAIAALARSEARFRTVVQNAPDAVWMFDGACPTRSWPSRSRSES